MSGKSIFDKLWERHVVTGNEGEPQLMYVDQHYIHEVTSPQAFQGLRDAGRKVRRPDLTFGTTDHNVPTVDIFNIRDLISKNQIDTLAKSQSANTAVPKCQIGTLECLLTERAYWI